MKGSWVNADLALEDREQVGGSFVARNRWRQGFVSVSTGDETLGVQPRDDLTQLILYALLQNAIAALEGSNFA